MSTIDELEAQFRTAQAATEEYSNEVTEKYRAAMPDPAEWKGPGPDPEMAYARARAWTEEETEHLNSLRTAAREAAVAWHRARQQAEGHTSGE